MTDQGLADKAERLKSALDSNLGVQQSPRPTPRAKSFSRGDLRGQERRRKGLPPSVEEEPEALRKTSVNIAEVQLGKATVPTTAPIAHPTLGRVGIVH